MGETGGKCSVTMVAFVWHYQYTGGNGDIEYDNTAIDTAT